MARTCVGSTDSATVINISSECVVAASVAVSRARNTTTRLEASVTETVSSDTRHHCGEAQSKEKDNHKSVHLESF